MLSTKSEQDGGKGGGGGYWGGVGREGGEEREEGRVSRTKASHLKLPMDVYAVAQF